MANTTTHGCDCSPDHPGILWPWGSAGEYPPALPYVERCDSCRRYDSDDAAADALGEMLLTVGLRPFVGEHFERTDDGGRRRVGVYVFPSRAAMHQMTSAPEWELLVRCAKSSLSLLDNAVDVPRRRHAEVYVVRPDDPSEDVAVFEHPADADAFHATYDHVGDVERATVCDRALAAQMIADRQADEIADADAKARRTCSRCLARTYRGEACVCDNDGDAGDDVGS